MPTPSNPFLVLKLYGLGYPWQFPVFQDLVNVKYGLFPDDPTLAPPGWTPDDLSNVKSFVDQTLAKGSEEERIAFVSQNRGAALPGRKIWKDWISRLWRTARIHERISAVLVAQDCHPLTLSLVQTEDAVTWPSGATWIPTCLDAIALELFGAEALSPKGRLAETYRPTVQAIVQRTWSYLTQRLERAQKRFAIYEQEAINAFNALDDTPSKANITAVIRSVAKWRNVAELLNTPDNMAKIATIEAELDRLMEGLGAEFSEEKKQKRSKKKSAAPKLFKLSNEMLKSLATEKAVQDVILLYREHFDNPSNVADDMPILESPQTLKNLFGTPVDGADIGAEFEAQMSPDLLAASLGFIKRDGQPGGLPLLFNESRRTDGLTAWSNPEAFKYKGDKAPIELEPLALHWHQLAGVHAIIRTCFTKTADPSIVQGFSSPTRSGSERPTKLPQ
ncbi:hypothetical protein BJ912DRAFT_1067891 [Pholiota molesta]|nr:hypothetical protein BJ912DRAFT_1067891 [Pholiota molesta]